MFMNTTARGLALLCSAVLVAPARAFSLAPCPASCGGAVSLRCGGGGGAKPYVALTRELGKNGKFQQMLAKRGIEGKELPCIEFENLGAPLPAALQEEWEYVVGLRAVLPERGSDDVGGRTIAPCFRVLPMGWKWSFFLAQLVHSRVVLEADPEFIARCWRTGRRPSAWMPRHWWRCRTPTTLPPPPRQARGPTGPGMAHVRKTKEITPFVEVPGRVGHVQPASSLAAPAQGGRGRVLTRYQKGMKTGLAGSHTLSLHAFSQRGIGKFAWPVTARSTSHAKLYVAVLLETLQAVG